MALGGGNFITQNKELPGAYINFVSTASASVKLSDRGIATMPLELDWGKEGEIFEVNSEDFQKNSLKIFGYAFDSPALKGIGDLFMGAKTLYAYRLNGGGEKASNAFATALYCGVRGNDLKVVVQANADNAE
ncbi:MAG: phage tail protein, partial [Lachnospiraceae bacterium]|nr:phage tail protein [Lachnospiraceae bacterium]